MAGELGSTAAEEMSVFQRLSLGNGRKPFRVAPWPSDIWLQADGSGGVPLTWKLRAEDWLLPGSGFSTTTEKVPADAALPVAVSCVEETKVVEIAEPLSSTCAPETNLLPLTVRL